MIGMDSVWAQAFLLITLVSTAEAFPLQNITIPLPVGTTNHGTPGLLCTPTKWSDIALFYVLNYVAHAATVLPRPGERSDDYMSSVIGSLLFPALGLYRGIEAILCGAIFVKNDDLRKAARSGALCMVVRGKDWQPNDGDEAGNAVFRREPMDAKESEAKESDAKSDASSTFTESTARKANHPSLRLLIFSPPWLCSKYGWPTYVHRQIVHGTYDLPAGYRFAIVPSDTQFAPNAGNTTLEVSATYSVVRALVALAQSCYALLTLYRARGDQIAQFGYAAFGLTVAPYAVMSVMNLLGNLCRPDYASLYMVESSIMDEARRRGGVFNGAVGKVKEGGAVVCACQFAEGDDVENLRFGPDLEDTMKVHLNTPAPPEIWSTSTINSTDKPHEKEPSSPSTCSSVTPRSFAIKPPITTLDQSAAKHNAILLLPCCAPIQRTPLLQLTDTPFRWSIKSIRLTRLCWPFAARDWSIVYHPTIFARRTLYFRLLKIAITTIIALSPLIIVGTMSHFSPGTIPLKDSANWRSYTMQWLTVSVFSGLWWVLDQEGKDATANVKLYVRPVTRALLYIVSASPAVGGFVVVGQMLSRYGVCVWIGD